MRLFGALGSVEGRRDPKLRVLAAKNSAQFSDFLPFLRIRGFSMGDWICKFRAPRPIFDPQIFPQSGTRKEQGLLHEGVGAKKFDVSLESQEKSNCLGWISRDFAGISWRRPKSLRTKNSAHFFGTYPNHFKTSVCSHSN